MCTPSAALHAAKIIEEFEHPALKIVLISVPHSPLQKGLFFKWKSHHPEKSI